jgi:hypothetical protein
MAVFKEKEWEDTVCHVKREIFILDKLDDSSDSSCETSLLGRLSSEAITAAASSEAAAIV